MTCPAENKEKKKIKNPYLAFGNLHPRPQTVYIHVDIAYCLSGKIIMAGAQTCYYPDKSVAAKDSPCHSPSVGDGASACCNSNDICLNNGLCLAQGGGEVISRGSCTDKDWESLECPQYCSDGKIPFQHRKLSCSREPLSTPGSVC